LLAKGWWRLAWELAGETTLGCLLVAGVMMLASHGQVWGIFKACASGGTRRELIMLAPLHVWQIASRADKGLILFFLLALVALLAQLFSPSVKFLQNLPVLFFLTTMAVTVVIFASPGVVTNHLIDVQIAAVVLFAVWLTKNAGTRQEQIGICALALATLVGAVPLAHKLKVWDGRFQPHRFQRTIAAIPDTHKPILAENPIIPVLAGQRVYVLDPWMLRMLRERIPDFGEPLLEALRQQDFAAVVLSVANPQTAKARAWYKWSDFGPGFLPALLENYHIAATVEDQLVYLPTDRSAQARMQPEASRTAQPAANVSTAETAFRKR